MTEFYPRLYPYLILIGGSILAATAWLLHEYRKQAVRSRELNRLNEELGYDLPDFLRHCWPPLRKGGFSGLSWQLDWFGTTLKGQHGHIAGNVIEKAFDVQEISLKVQIYSRQRSWERRYFAGALAENFFLLVRMNLWIKLGTVQGAFEQSAKMVVFLQHDVKNLVQLISLVTEQLESPVPGQEQKLLENLRQTMPSVRDRAQHMLDALSQRKLDVTTRSIDLPELIRSTAQAYELQVTIEGSADIELQVDRLQTILDNLFTNYARQQHKQTGCRSDIHVTISKNVNQVAIQITDHMGDPCLWPERLFEPFWSEHGAGRGIGLYQARQQAVTLGGSLTACATAGMPLSFTLTLPCAQ